MFKAILAGKAGRLPCEITAGASWAHVFKQTEDLLTATVFERLAYLPGEQLWSVLRATFGSVLPAYRVAQLTSIEFWPRWADGLTGGTVEPDLFLQFDLGDPTQRIDLILEAKLGGIQYSYQWRRQWEAYQAISRSAEDGQRPADAVYLLAIGGLTGSARNVVDRFTSEITLESKGSVAIVAAAADWSQLGTSLKEVVAGHPSNQRIINDIEEALAIFGFRHLETFGSLSRMEKLRSPARSLSVLRQKI